jgi:citronellyl-CoA synthetase
MAALVLKEESPLPSPPIDLHALLSHMQSMLPSYAIPQFIRILPRAPLTGTFKHIKKELREEAFDVTRVSDPVYKLIDMDGIKSYHVLTLDMMHDIYAGHARM